MQALCAQSRMRAMRRACRIGATRSISPRTSPILTARALARSCIAREAGEAALRRHAEPWRIDSTAWYGEPEERRRLFAQIMGCDVEGVALVPATSYGFAVAAKNISLRAGQRILVLADEFPSGIHTWRRKAAETGAEIITVVKRDSESWTEAVLTALKDERIAIVSVPNVHWHDGALIELPLVALRAREIGAKLVVDSS